VRHGRAAGEPGPGGLPPAFICLVLRAIWAPTGYILAGASWMVGRNRTSAVGRAKRGPG
jgi:hypothetical protein